MSGKTMNVEEGGSDETSSQPLLPSPNDEGGKARGCNEPPARLEPRAMEVCVCPTSHPPVPVGSIATPTNHGSEEEERRPPSVAALPEGSIHAEHGGLGSSLGRAGASSPANTRSRVRLERPTTVRSSWVCGVLSTGRTALHRQVFLGGGARAVLSCSTSTFAACATNI